MSELGFNNDESPNKTSNQLHLPSPIITRRNRTHSTSERAFRNPLESGKIKTFCRGRGHGFVTPDAGGEDIFVHISDIEGEYIPLPGDEVTYRLCPIPPKFEKNQAVQVKIVNFAPERHFKWDEARNNNRQLHKCIDNKLPFDTVTEIKQILEIFHKFLHQYKPNGTRMAHRQFSKVRLTHLVSKNKSKCV